MTWSAHLRLKRLVAPLLRPHRRHRRPVPLRLEVLEDRTVLSPATPLGLSPAGSGTQAGTINTPGGSDLYQFTAPVTGGMTVQQDAAAGSNLDSDLTVYDGSHNPIAANDNAPVIGFVPNGGATLNTLDSQVHLNVVAGQTYLVQAAASPHATGAAATGAYVLSFSTIADDGHGHSLANPTRLSLDPTGVTLVGGAVGTPGAADYFQFTAAATGTLALQQNAAAGSDLDSALTVYDGSGSQLAADDDVAQGATALSTFDSALDVNVVAGQTYTIVASASPYADAARTTGAYVLTIAPLTSASFPSTAGQITPVTLDASGAATVTGTITGNADPNNADTFTPDSDWYQFTPTLSGALDVQVAAAAGSDFQGYLSLEDASGKVIASGSGQLAAAVDSTQTYTLQVTAPSASVSAYANASVGAYILGFRTTPADDVGETFADATTLTLDSNGAATATGAIGIPGSNDDFQFTAAATGVVTVRDDAAPGSALATYLLVYDANQTLTGLANTYYSINYQDSQATLTVTAGQTYYVQAGASPSASGNQTTGAYVLTVAPVVEDHYGADFSTATPLALGSSGSGTAGGTIENPGGVDLFQFTAPVTGALTIQLDPAAGSNLDGDLTVYDAGQNQLADNVADWPTDNSQVQVDVAAGQTYYVQAAAAPSAFGPLAVGAYVLSFATLGDDGFSHDPAGPSPLALDSSGSAVVSGVIADPAAADYFQFTAAASGSVTVTQGAAAGSDLDSDLTVYDDTGTPLATDDDASFATVNSAVQFYATAGQTYVLAAASSVGTVGGYVLSIAPTFANPGTITLDAAGAGRQTGAIRVPGGADAYQFTATVTGGLTIQMSQAPGSGLQTNLSLYDATQQLLTSGDGQVQWAVTAGQTYYLAAGSSPDANSSPSDGTTTGAYALSFATVPADGYGTSFATATPLTLDDSGAGGISGTIDLSGASDYFAFVAPVTGGMAIRQNAAAGSNLDSSLTVYDANHDAITANDDAPSDSAVYAPLDSAVSFRVVRGDTYFVQASASAKAAGSQATGAYALTLDAIPADGFGTGFETATPLTPTNDAVAVTGTIPVPGAADYFQFTAASTGLLTVQQQAPAGSVLDSSLSVYDSSRTLLAANDNASAVSSDSRLQINVTAGQTYYVQAAAGEGGDDRGTGAYLLSIGDSLGNAVPVTLDRAGAATVTGNITLPGRVDSYQFTATRTGELTVEDDTPPGGTYPTFLQAYDGDQQLLDFNRGGAGHGNSVIHFDVTAGQTYYLQASAAPGASSAGGYTLTFTTGARLQNDGFGHDLSGPTQLLLDASQAATRFGTIDEPGGLDVFRIEPSRTGELIVGATATGDPHLQGSLAVFNAARQEVASSDGNGGASDPFLIFSAAAGQTYYVVVGGLTTNLGDYELTVQAKPYGSTFADATPLSLDPATHGTTLQGTIAVVGQGDLFQFKAAATGKLVLEQDAATGSSLDSYLTVYDGNQQVVTSNDDINYPSNLDSQVTLGVTAGQTYYVRAAASPYAIEGTQTGAYVLTLTDPFASAPALALDPATGTGSRAGSINTPGAVQTYRFTAPVTGAFRVTQAATPGGSLDPYLTAYDHTETALGSFEADDDSLPGLTTAVVQVNLTAGQTYYVQAAASPFASGEQATGDYTLSVSAVPADPYGHTFATATPLAVDPVRGATLSGTVANVGDQDVFRFTAKASGALTLTMSAAAGGVLDSQLNVYDSATASQPFATNDDASSFTLDSQLQINVTAGHTYYVQAQASSYAASVASDPGFTSSYPTYTQTLAQTLTGDYVLTIAPVPADPFGSSFSDATPLTLNAAGAATVSGDLPTANRSDWFTFTAAKTGTLVFAQNAGPNSNLDSFLGVYDDEEILLASNDDASGGTRDSLASVFVTAGQTYYVQAGSSPFAYGGPSATGGYTLTIAPGADDGYGHTFATATPLTPAPTGSATARGTIEASGGMDVFTYTATATTNLLITQDAASASSLDSSLTVYDGSRKQIAADDDSNGTLNSEVTLGVTAGQTYYIQAAASAFAYPGTATGAYVLNVRPLPDDGIGHTLDSATTLPIDPAGTGRAAGTIQTADGADYFEFKATFTGQLVANLGAAPGSSLNSTLTVYDSSQNQIAYDDDVNYPLDLDSRLEFAVTSGQTYYVEAASSPYYYDSSGSPTGDYVLSLAPAPADKYGTTFASAGTLALNTPVTGDLTSPNAVNVFRFTAPTTGVYLFRQGDDAGSYLAGDLSVYDANQDLLAADDDVTYPTPPDSQVQISLTAGQTYYVRVAASPEAISNQSSYPDYYQTAAGGFVLSVSPVPGDGYGNTLATATPLTLDATNSAVVNGILQDPNTPDVFRFTAAETTDLTVTQDAAPGSNLDSYLTVFNAGRQAVAQNDDSGGTFNSRVTVHVVAGHTYYVQAGTSPYADGRSNNGRFVLTIHPVATDGFGNTFATAHVVSLAGTPPQAHVRGNVAAPGNVDFLQFTATDSGSFTVRMSAGVNSGLDPYLFVYNSTHDLLTSDDNSGGGLNSLVQFNVTAGQTYFVEAAGNQGTTGTYGLTFSLSAANTQLGPSDPSITLDGHNGGRQNGAITAPDSSDFYQFTAQQSGWVTIQEKAPSGSGLDPLLTVYNSSQQQIAFNDDGKGTLNSRVLLNVKAGATYYVQAGGYGLSTGAYRLLINSTTPPTTPNVEDFGTAETATLSADGSANLAGDFSVAGDVTVYRFTATTTGRLTATLTPDAGSDLDASLRLFTLAAGQSTQLASNDLTDAGAGQAQTIQIDVTAGQTYYLRVASSDTDTAAVTDAATDPRVGAFSLALQTTAGGASSSGRVDPTALQATGATLRDSFTQNVVATGYTAVGSTAITQAVVQAYLNSVGGSVASNTLILFFDPADEIVTDPLQRQTGFTTDRGAINENASAVLSRNGALQLLIIPNALVGAYGLDLAGVGQDHILAGASLITPEGVVLAPEILQAGQAVSSLTDLSLSKSGLEVVLDFSLPAQPGALGLAGVPGEVAGGGPGGVLTALAQPGQAVGQGFNLAASIAGGVANVSLSNLGNQALATFGPAAAFVLVSGLGTLLTPGQLGQGGEVGSGAGPWMQVPTEVQTALQDAGKVGSLGTSYVVSTASAVLERVAGMLRSAGRPFGLDDLSLSGLPWRTLLSDLATTLSPAAAAREVFAALSGALLGGKGEPVAPTVPRTAPGAKDAGGEKSLPVSEDFFFEGLRSPPGWDNGAADEDGEGVWADLDRTVTPLAASLIACGLHQAFWRRLRLDEAEPWPRRPYFSLRRDEDDNEDC